MKHSEEIIKAWGVHYNKVKKAINENGYGDNDLFPDDYNFGCIFLLNGNYKKVSIDNRLYFVPNTLLNKNK